MPGLEVITEGNSHNPPPPPAPAGDAPPGSVLAQLRERANAERHTRTLDVPVGTERWGDMLTIRYRMPGMEEADRLLAATARFAGADTSGQGVSMGQAGLELMATCCVTVIAHIDDRNEDLEVRLTGRLLSMLGLPYPPGVENPNDVTAREVVEQLFDENWVAINVHAGQIMGWLQQGVGGLGEASSDS